MSDLTTILPHLPPHVYVRLLPSLERARLATADLLTQPAPDIARRAHLPLPDVQSLCQAVLEALWGELGVNREEPARVLDGVGHVDHGGEKKVNGDGDHHETKGEEHEMKDDVSNQHEVNVNNDENGDTRGITSNEPKTDDERESGGEKKSKLAPSLRTSGLELLDPRRTACIGTLDPTLDAALGGGIPTGCVTEITGESGVGKTQFLLTLLLAVQLPAPHGLGSNALYISTESALPTNRLSQLRTQHPIIAASPEVSLDRIISVVTPDIESQDHILWFQVPVAIRRHGVRLLIIDSIAANYRAEFERPGAKAAMVQNTGANMAQRSTELVKLGQFLRDLAREHELAIVVANQVADRFSGDSTGGPQFRQAQAAVTVPSSLEGLGLTPEMEGFVASVADPMALDHQQRWFTGWGDDPYGAHLEALKTPSLGLIWTTQLACRIALIKRPVYGPATADVSSEEERGEPVLRLWRRWMKVVFARGAGGSGPGVRGAVEFAIRGGGVVAVERSEGGE